MAGGGVPPALITFLRSSVDELADQFQNGNQRVCKRRYRLRTKIAVRYVNSEIFRGGLGVRIYERAPEQCRDKQTITRERNLPALPGQVV